jgi:hypothetical protein
MFNEKLKRAICVMGTAMMLSSVVVPTGMDVNAATATAKASKENSLYAQRFLDIYNTIKDDNSGYFDENGVPYHSVETLMVEAPDQGHESTSEAASYLVWLEAMKGNVTGNYDSLKTAWDVVENYFIPTSKDQPGQTDYNASKPATYASEFNDPSLYPSELKQGAAVGSDPLYSELKNAYGNPYIYGMHWLIDVDNFYGFGLRGQRNSTKPVYINTYQRGKEESCFETVPQPCWDDLKAGGPNGYLDLFTKDNGYSAQWKYTNAPDADARLMQAMYGARDAAKEDGVNIKNLTDKTAKMGDFLRYSMFDKYFRKIGQPSQAGNGRDSQHYLLSWYYAWGGSTTQSWSWRIGCSHSHFGYQSPFAAWMASTDSDFYGKGSTGKSDWAKSLQRQKELYTWLQSDNGAIAGGCSNSWNGAYEEVPSNVNTFYGMGYTEHPVYADPGSNRWFGMQCWSMQRMCEYYYRTGDEDVKNLVNKWANWAESETTVIDSTFSIPSNLIWSGQPDTWEEGQTIAGWEGHNKGLTVSVESYGEDVGVAGSLANALLYVAAANKKYGGEVDKYRDTATALLDCMHDNYMDDKGVAVNAPWDAAERFFNQEIYIPSGWTGKMPNGDQIKSGVTFLDIRSQYKNDPDYDRVEAAYRNGETVMMKYHRFWAQVEYAVACGVASNLAEEIGINDAIDPNVKPSVKPSVAPSVKPSVAPSVKPSVAPSVKPSVAPSVKPSVAPSVKPSVAPVDSSVKVDTGNGQWTITNTNGSVDLSDVTIRYYIKSEGTAADVVYVDNAGLSLSKAPYYANLTSDISAKVVKMSTPKNGADAYVEITFNTNYAIDASSRLNLGIRMAKADWSNFDNTNDYSYTNGAVVYVNGSCVSGNEI